MIDDLYLRHDQTVARRFAHRRAVSEVLVTDSAEGDDGEYFAAVQIPRSHLLWGDREPSHHDPLAVVEACRQATFVISHRHLRVPIGPVFILHDIDFEVTELDAFREVECTPLDALVRVKAHDASDDHVLTELTFRGQVRVDGQPAMDLGGSITFLDRHRYDVLRAFARPERTGAEAAVVSDLPASLRSRGHPANIVIAAPETNDGERRFPIVTDRRHPSFYDHPLDHVPGSLMIEAARQTTIATAAIDGRIDRPEGLMTSFRSDFNRFAEHDTELTCTAEPLRCDSHRISAEVNYHQDGQRIAHATTTIEVP